jgi:peptidoglycan hydrolase CwlO-like protein
MTDADIINELMTFYKKKTVQDFAVFLERDRGEAIYNVLNGHQKISKALLKDLKEHCIDFNPKWIETGEGEKFRTKEEVEKILSIFNRDSDEVKALKEELLKADGKIDILLEQVEKSSEEKVRLQDKNREMEDEIRKLQEELNQLKSPLRKS